MKAVNSAWNKANPDKARESVRKWRAANPDVFRASQRASEQRRRSAAVGALFDEVDLLSVLSSAVDCYLCGKQLSGDIEADHVVPLSNGGAHSHQNLRPVHDGCNARKKDRPLSELDYYQGSTLLGAWSVRPVTCRR
jgi:5-methylcytosine-specific restriction endonuclease McrA